MKYLVLLSLTWVYACTDCHDSSVNYCKQEHVDQAPIDIRTDDTKTADEIQDWVQATADCFGEPIDVSNVHIEFVPDDAAVTKDCGTSAAGCYLYSKDGSLSQIELSLESRWAWPEEVAHELGHLHYATTTGDGDFNHDHGIWFGRPPSDYNWSKATGSVANCVDLEFVQ